MDFWLLILTLACYFLATLIWLGYLWIQKDALYRFGTGIMALGWCSHTLALILETIAQGFFPVANFGGTLSLFSWTLVTAFLVLIWRYPVKVLGALVSPMAGLMVCGSLILPSPGEIPPTLQTFLAHLSYRRQPHGRRHPYPGLFGRHNLSGPGASA